MKLKDLSLRFKTLIPDILDQGVMSEAAIIAKEMVRSHTKKGYGVDKEGAPQKRLKGLSESYKKQRRRLKRQGILSPDTTPNKSNLTNTGDMLKSLSHRSTRNTATVFLKGDKEKKKAEKQAKVGRKFMNLSKSERQRIKKIIQEAIHKGINKKGL